MKKQAVTTAGDRQLKFAEAGILFVLILALTLFVGAKVVSKNSGRGTAVAEPEAAPEMETTDSFLALGDGTAADGFAAPQEAVVGRDLAAGPPRVVTYALSEQAYFAGNFDEAADLFSAYVQEHPGNAWGHYMLGLSSWKAGDPEAAETAFLAALDLQPDHLKSRINYGRVLLEMGRSQDARVQLEAALASDPVSVDANRVLGRAYHNLGLLGEAAASYRTALSLKIDDVWSLNNLGLIYLEQEQFARALPPLAKAAQLKQDAACIQNNLGVALERNGHLRDSQLAFERALAANGLYAKAEASLQRVSALAGSEEGAVLDLDLIAASFTAGPAPVDEVAASADPEAAAPVEAIAVASSEIQAK